MAAALEAMGEAPDPAAEAAKRAVVEGNNRRYGTNQKVADFKRRSMRNVLVMRERRVADKCARNDARETTRARNDA